MKKIIGILFITFLTLLAGCSKDPQPQDRFADYVKLWNQQKFDKMYSYLSKDAKKDISKEQFTTRYQKIYKDLEIKGLKIEFKKPKEEKREKPVYTFTVNMTSMAGPINFSNKAVMKKQEKNWYVDWNPSFIFAKLQ